MIDETARQIRDMRTHSSSSVAITAAGALLGLVEREYPSLEEFTRDVERNSTQLRQANPSHASLQNTQHRIVDILRDADPSDVQAAKDTLENAVEDTVASIQGAQRRAAVQAVELLTDGDVVLTHDYSTTVLAALEEASDRELSLSVYVTEARPRYMGRRMARHVAGIEHMDATLIVDSAAGHFLSGCDRVLVGMTSIAGDILYNRVGTFGLAACANQRNVPFTVVGAATKVIDGEFVFENDFRSAVEVMREPTEAFHISNPAYDATPLDLVDSVVTDDGRFHPG